MRAFDLKINFFHEDNIFRNMSKNSKQSTVRVRLLPAGTKLVLAIGRSGTVPVGGICRRTEYRKLKTGKANE